MAYTGTKEGDEQEAMYRFLTPGRYTCTRLDCAFFCVAFCLRVLFRQQVRIIIVYEVTSNILQVSFVVGTGYTSVTHE